MRISDWSSDVCSSDLIGRQHLAAPHDRARWPGDPEHHGQWIGLAGNAGRGIDAHDHARRRIAVGRQVIPAVLQDERRGCIVGGGLLGTGSAGLEAHQADLALLGQRTRSEEHTTELPSLMRTSYAVFYFQKKKPILTHTHPS